MVEYVGNERTHSFSPGLEAGDDVVSEGSGEDDGTGEESG